MNSKLKAVQISSAVFGLLVLIVVVVVHMSHKQEVLVRLNAPQSFELRLPPESQVFDSTGREVLFDAPLSLKSLCEQLRPQFEHAGFKPDSMPDESAGRVVWFRSDGDLVLVLDDVRGVRFGSETLPDSVDFHLWLASKNQFQPGRME